MKYLARVLCIVLVLCGFALPQSNCPAGTTAISSRFVLYGKVVRGVGTAPSDYLCETANGSIFIPNIVALNGGMLMSRTPQAAATFTALPGDGIDAATNTAARTVTLTMATAGMQALNLVTWYYIVDEAGTAATGNITITPATGTVSGAANVKVVNNFGSWFGYCTSTACFTLHLQ